jgi:hypothetical protein
VRARKPRAATADNGLEDLGRDTTDALGHSRDQLIAIEAARPWAVRILLAAAIGDRGDALQRGLAFLIAHFYNGKVLEAQRT